MKYLSLFILVLGAFSLRAQNTLHPSIYFPNLHYYNPAVGLLDSVIKHDVAAYYKTKFTNNDDEIWDKPANVWLNYIGRLGDRSGFSAAYLSDRYSFYNRNQLYAGYYRDLLSNPEKSLNVGGRVVLNFDKVNWEEAPQAGKGTDSETFFRTDFDLGVQYQGKRLGAGLSSKNLFNSKVEVDGETLLENHRELYGNVSYRFNIGKFNITPFVLTYWERDFELDAGLNLDFNRRFSFSYILRTFELRNIFALQANIGKGLYLGAATDFSSIYDDLNLDVQLGYRF